MASRLVRVNPVTVNDVLDGHVSLDLECLDRIYLNGYLAELQVGGQVVQFLRHLGFVIPSPACLQQIGDAFRRSVASFADANHIPVVRFGIHRPQDRCDAPYLDRQRGRPAFAGRRDRGGAGVAAGVHRPPRDTEPCKPPWFSFAEDRRVTVFYFYLWDDDFGPAFIKVCAYFPYPIKIWVNGHEWAKRQATRAGIGFTELSNGFAATPIPAALQAICDRLGPGTIQVFFRTLAGPVCRCR